MKNQLTYLMIGVSLGIFIMWASFRLGDNDTEDKIKAIEQRSLKHEYRADSLQKKVLENKRKIDSANDVIYRQRNRIKESEERRIVTIRQYENYIHGHIINADASQVSSTARALQDSLLQWGYFDSIVSKNNERI